MTEEQFKNRCAEIIRENITFSGQLNDYVIHGALDAIWKLYIDQQQSIENNICDKLSYAEGISIDGYALVSFNSVVDLVKDSFNVTKEK